MTTLRRKIHENPELAFEEYETTKLIERELNKYGIETRPNGDKTGVIGLLKGSGKGKVAALRADIDALPVTEMSGLPFASASAGKCHACGHDIHTAALLGAARLLAERRDELHGAVKFLFQPAEESVNGARTMIANGALKNPDVDVILALHTWPDLPIGSVGIRKGAMMAAPDRFRIVIHGKGGHAAHPHKSVDPVVVGASIIMNLQTIVAREISPVDSAVITIGKLAAGTASNVIPPTAELDGTFRTVSKETRLHVRESLERVVTHTALSLRATADVEFFPGGPPLICDDETVDAAADAVRALLGGDTVKELPSPSMGSEDFADYLEHVKGALLRIGTGNQQPESHVALHNPSILFDERAIVTGAIVLAGAAFKLTGSDFDRLFQ
ncbi:MAG: amidohydrolase [Synergistaceae bacterium]|nr:amidohydrolase [Synergistaceae bacterium]